MLEAFLFTSKYRLQNWRCAFSICEPSQVLKFCLAYTPQISLLYVRIGEITVSNILQARAAFSLLKMIHVSSQAEEVIKSFLLEMFTWLW